MTNAAANYAYVYGLCSIEVPYNPTKAGVGSDVQQGSLELGKGEVEGVVQQRLELFASGVCEEGEGVGRGPGRPVRRWKCRCQPWLSDSLCRKRNDEQI